MRPTARRNPTFSAPSNATSKKKYDGQARELSAKIKKHAAELEPTLQSEALPVTADPSAILVARGEVEAALRVAPKGDVMYAMTRLARKGGDIAAAASSEWGRAVYEAAGGNDAGFDLVRAEAVKTALKSEDEGRRRAAEALQATEAPRPDRPGPGVPVLYEAIVKATSVLEDTRRVVSDVILP